MRLDKITLLQAMGITANPETKGEVNIIDVSGYTGEIDFSKLEPYVRGEKSPRIDGAIVRLTDGASYDNYYLRNYNGFKALGLPVGGYGVHYVRANASANVRQAQYLIDAVDQLGEYPALGVYGDWERNPDKLGISLTRQAIWKYVYTYEEALDEILKAYTNYWWTANVANPTNGATDIPKGRDGWFASWYAKTPYIPWDWSQRYGNNCWVLWQYENRFRFDGMPGSADMSTFNGTMAEYRQYFKLEPTPAPPPPEPDPLPEPIVPIKRVKVNDTVAWLNVRAQPDLGAADLGDLIKASVVPVVEVNGDWYRINGWIHKDYVQDA